MPEAVSNTIGNDLRNLESRPPEQAYFAPEDMRVIGSLLLDQAAGVIEEVGADIEATGLDGYTLPPNDQLESIADFGLDLSNPYVPVEQRYYTPGQDLEDTADFKPVAPAANGCLSAQVFLDYDLGGRLRSMDVRGQARPSMGIFPFLVEAGGRPVRLAYMPHLDIDTGETVGDPVARSDLSAGDFDERFIGAEAGSIDWETPRIGLDSSWFKVGGNGTKVDGNPERVYQVPTSGSFELVRGNADNPGAADAEVVVTSASSAGEQPVNLWLSDDWTSESELTIEYGAISDLTMDPDCDALNGNTIQHVNAQQTVTLERGSTSVQVTRYGHQRENPQSGERAFRVMMETYQAPVNGVPVRREYEYFSNGIGTQSEIGESLKKADQPDLLRSVRVLRSNGSVSAGTFCDGEGESFSVESSPDEMQLYVGFDYMRFADYLESIGTPD